MKAEIKKRIVYEDLLGVEHSTEQFAIQSNHDIHLVFRNYISNELIRTFSDGKINNLKTTKEIWDNLDFTPECIKRIYEIEMGRK